MQFIDLKTQQKRIKKNINVRIKNVLNHGKYIMGPEVFELEEKLSKFTGRKYSLTCSSGTDALLISLMNCDIGVGDAVFTTPFTYIATAGAILQTGATPFFVDIYPKTYNMDPNQLNKAIQLSKKKGLNPRAIIPVDLFGLPARYRLIEKISKEYDLIIIEDAAQGFGGKINENMAGAFGSISTTSFFPAKPLGCYGDGGAIFTDDLDAYNKMKSIRIHGSGEDKYDNVRLGLNGRLDTLQAAILLEKLNIFNDELDRRDKIAKYYSSNISELFKKPFVPRNYHSSWAQYSLMTNSLESRNNIMKLFNDKNIPIMCYYKIPLHLQKLFLFLGYENGDFPISENSSNCIFSIPMHPYLSRDEQDVIISILNKYIEK